MPKPRFPSISAELVVVAHIDRRYREKLKRLLEEGRHTISYSQFVNDEILLPWYEKDKLAEAAERSRR